MKTVAKTTLLRLNFLIIFFSTTFLHSSEEEIFKSFSFPCFPKPEISQSKLRSNFSVGPAYCHQRTVEASFETQLQIALYEHMTDCLKNGGKMSDSSGGWQVWCSNDGKIINLLWFDLQGGARLFEADLDFNSRGKLSPSWFRFAEHQPIACQVLSFEQLSPEMKQQVVDKVEQVKQILPLPEDSMSNLNLESANSLDDNPELRLFLQTHGATFPEKDELAFSRPLLNFPLSMGNQNYRFNFDGMNSSLAVFDQKYDLKQSEENLRPPREFGPFNSWQMPMYQDVKTGEYFAKIVYSEDVDGESEKTVGSTWARFSRAGQYLQELYDDGTIGTVIDVGSFAFMSYAAFQTGGISALLMSGLKDGGQKASWFMLKKMFSSAWRFGREHWGKISFAGMVTKWAWPKIESKVCDKGLDKFWDFIVGSNNKIDEKVEIVPREEFGEFECLSSKNKVFRNKKNKILWRWSTEHNLWDLEFPDGVEVGSVSKEGKLKRVKKTIREQLLK